MLATKLETLQNLIQETLERCKRKYYKNISKNICSKVITTKYYWSILKTKKITCILPVICDHKFVTNFSERADLCNCFFAKQCSIIDNRGVLPSSTNPIIDQYLSNIEFTKDDIKRIICKLNSSKYGYDMFSICMLKMSGDTIIEAPFTILKNCLKCGIFWITAKRNIVVF